jgi:hypothetical protein
MFSHNTPSQKIEIENLKEGKPQNKLLILHFMERSEIYVTKFMVPSYGFKLY